jgi:ABC-type glycerol-3-phosphate transport system substrate-binding protein
MLRILILGLLILVLLTACGAPAPGAQTTDQQSQPVVTIFKAPT